MATKKKKKKKREVMKQCSRYTIRPKPWLEFHVDVNAKACKIQSSPIQ